MAVLGADSPFRFLGSPTKFVFSANVAGDVHYAGALLFIDTAGGAQAVPATGDMFVGIVTKQQTPAAIGDPIEAFIDGVFLLPTGASITAADEGDILCLDLSDALYSDNPADLESNLDITSAAGDIKIGRIIRVTTEGMWVKLEPGLCVNFGTTPAVQTYV